MTQQNEITGSSTDTGKIPASVLEYYSDILAHEFEPNGGLRISAANTNGQFEIIRREFDDGGPAAEAEVCVTLPGQKAATSLHWALPGVFVGTGDHLYLFGEQGDGDEISSKPTATFSTTSSVQDVCTIPSSDDDSQNGNTKVVAGYEDGKVRIWDIETRKIFMEINNHNSVVEVCTASSEHFATGGQNGKIFIYDGKFRTNLPIKSFEYSRKLVTALGFSRNCSWLAGGSHGSPLIYNLQSGTALPQIKMDVPKQMNTLTFDSQNTLWWAGAGGIVYGSRDLLGITNALEAKFGHGVINHIYSITTTGDKMLSVAGSTNGILLSLNGGNYWDSMVYM